MKDGVDIIHQRSHQIGDVKVTFTVGRITPKQLSVDHRPAPDAPPQLGITPDNFDQILADVLTDMNADDEAAAAATTHKDDSF